MPLLDHFRPPVANRVQWNTIHASWAGKIADHLNSVLPPGFTMEERVFFSGGIEIDLAALEEADHATANGHGPTTALLAARWAPPAPTHVVPGDIPDAVEVRVFDHDGGKTLVGAIELVSPSNKDRPAERRAFAAKVVSYITNGASVVVVDPVTTRRANLHNEVVEMLELPADTGFALGAGLYAAAYRLVTRGGKVELDIWTNQIAVGEPLPTMPLRLTGDLFVPVDLEATYMTALRSRRVI